MGSDMLGRLIPRRATNEPNQQVVAPVRRAANNEAAPTTTLEAPEPPSSIESVHALLSELGECRGVMAEAVPKASQDKCLVLDLGFSTVILLALPSFASTVHHASVKHHLASRGLSIAKELLANEEVLREVEQTLRNQRSSGRPRIEDMRNKTLYGELVEGAYKLGATDLHIVYREGTSDVRLRLYGRMVDWKSLPSEHIRGALAAGYSSMIVEGTNSEPDWSPSKPCSAITEHQVHDSLGKSRRISGRFTSRPTVDGGCKTSIRILETDVKNVRVPSLEELGYAPSHIQDQLNPALRKNQGCILISGGTGSGKSMTLRTFMDNLPDKEGLERYSVEDPVEYVLPGVVQLSIQRASDASEESTRRVFTSALRDLMRMDPDAVMIGEIRDEETARLASELVNTGHRVLSTVHGNGAIDVLDRLTGKTLAVAPETIASGSYLLACMYQKLLPLLCPECKQPAKERLTFEQRQGIARFGLDAGTLFVARPGGCPHCKLRDISATGTRGLTVVAEVVTPTPELLGHVRCRNWQAARTAWRSLRKAGYAEADMTGKTAFEHALYKMSRGLIDINDIERDFEPLKTYDMGEVQGA